MRGSIEVGFQQVNHYKNLNDVLLSDTQKINLEFSKIFMIKAIK